MCIQSFYTNHSRSPHLSVQPQVRPVGRLVKCWAGDICASPVSWHLVLVRRCCSVTEAGTVPIERERERSHEQTTQTIRSEVAICFRVVCPSSVNAISQECLEGISSNLVQTLTWTQGWTDSILVIKGECQCDLTKHVFGHNSRIHKLTWTKWINYLFSLQYIFESVQTWM